LCSEAVVTYHRRGVGEVEAVLREEDHDAGKRKASPVLPPQFLMDGSMIELHK